MFANRLLIPCLALAAATLSKVTAVDTANVLREVKPSANETIRLLDVPIGDSGGYRIVVDVNGKQASLPGAPEALEATGEKDWASTAMPEFQISPDGGWIFASHKICTGYCIGCLYQRSSGAAYKVSTQARFDALAWRFFAEEEEVGVEELLASDSPAHLIDLLQLGNQHVAIRLRGAVFEISPDKQVAQRAKNSIDETGVYDWCCVYDLKQGKFFVTDTMEDHNANAWKRWASEDNVSWAADTLLWVEALEKRLAGQLTGKSLDAFRQEQAAWRKEVADKQTDQDFSELAFLRSRAGALEIRLLESISR